MNFLNLDQNPWFIDGVRSLSGYFLLARKNFLTKAILLKIIFLPFIKKEEQQFTAFKPLAHRPEPMLARP